MLKLFGAGKSDHPMADLKEAKRILEELPVNDAFKAADELSHWLDSVAGAEGFKPDYRAQLTQLLDEAAQGHVRKLTRDYLASTNLSKFQEGRVWKAAFEYWRHAALAFAGCIDLYATGAKGASALNDGMPLLAVRAIRALAAQMRWLSFRYSPMDPAQWGILYKIYALAEARRFAGVQVQVLHGVPGESTPELEFLKAVMFSASSPDSLLPVEIELMERLVALFAPSFSLSTKQQPDVSYWVDLAGTAAPMRLARPPQPAPGLRFFSAGKAIVELEQLRQTIRTTGAVPSSVNLGGNYEAEVVLDALDHLALYWASTPPARKAPRHQVKSRLAVTHGFNGVLAALNPASTLDFDGSAVENWIVQNVSTGGFRAAIPQVKGEWLKIGCLLGLQPEGGNNWVVGLVRRVNRETPQQAYCGIQTLAKSALPVRLRPQSGQSGASADAVVGILLDPLAQGSTTESQILMRAGTLVAGQNLELEQGGMNFLLMPQGVIERGEDFELIRFRQMIRDTSE